MTMPTSGGSSRTFTENLEKERYNNNNNNNGDDDCSPLANNNNNGNNIDWLLTAFFQLQAIAKIICNVAMTRKSED